MSSEFKLLFKNTQLLSKTTLIQNENKNVTFHPSYSNDFLLSNNNFYNNERLSIEHELMTGGINKIFINIDNQDFIEKSKSLYSSILTDKLSSLMLSSLYGAFLGDSLGSYCEFKYGHKDLFKSSKVFNGVNPIFNTSPGQLTDDSEMALCLGYGILDSIYNKTMNSFQDRVGYYYCQWLLSNPFDIGNTTEYALSAPFEKRITLGKCFFYEKDLFFNSISKKIKGQSSLSNGFLMRKTPLALYSIRYIDFSKSEDESHISNQNLNEFHKIHYEETRLTHSSNETIFASYLYSYLITRVIFLKYKGNDDLVFIVNNLKEHIEIYINNYLNTLKSQFTNDSSDLEYYSSTVNLSNKILSIMKTGEGHCFDSDNYHKHMGWYFHSLAYCFNVIYKISTSSSLDKGSYIDYIIEIINLGGDTDTNAAILGGFIGVLYGIETFPEEYLNKLIEFNSVKGSKKRDAIYSPINGMIFVKKLNEFFKSQQSNENKENEYCDDGINNNLVKELNSVNVEKLKFNSQFPYSSYEIINYFLK